MVTDFIHHNMIKPPMWNSEKFDFKSLLKYSDQIEKYISRFNQESTVEEVISYIETVVNKFVVTYKDYTGVQIFRAMSINDYEKYNGVGLYWSNHVEKAVSYHSNDDSGWIVLRSIVNLRDIDWDFMMKYYDDVASPWEEIESGIGESEIRIVKGSSLLLTGYDVTYPADVFTSVEVFVKA